MKHKFKKPEYPKGTIIHILLRSGPTKGYRMTLCTKDETAESIWEWMMNHLKEFEALTAGSAIIETITVLKP